ncbi:DUF3025 domain-containing protein [Rhodoferax sp.]|uniref:DUF3025 domain-containing protein n=1 Tax=Rhodoferax sp. TaxID=50421 RepID=UPI002841902B|nr:DUF3025 domain-containing protein [Rhodoferax sp.]MDR3371521.1 DUF3025 domain-containing protein [Rhodoferax sp.]
MIATINWRAPWLSPWRTLGEPAAHLVLAGMPQPEALNNVAQALWPAPGQAPVRFVPQSDLPPGMAYEQYIFDSGGCPTRKGLHDFFNALAWMNFPLTKRRLNQLHAAQIAQTGIAPVRGPTRDALTLFDENAALLRAPDALWDALVDKDWCRVFGELRPLWQQSQLTLFGHALLEKLVVPRKSMSAHVYRVHPATDEIADVDTWLAADLSADKLASKPFAHLPVLGVPLWWLGNEVPGFYDDPSVFRVARRTLAAPLK